MFRITHPDRRNTTAQQPLAEHRHFGRAAAALHITPSSLSRQITRLEQQVAPVRVVRWIALA
jgi:hypothetical protein